jgi:hypothetical protein
MRVLKRTSTRTGFAIVVSGGKRGAGLFHARSVVSHFLSLAAEGYALQGWGSLAQQQTD